MIEHVRNTWIKFKAIRGETVMLPKDCIGGLIEQEKGETLIQHKYLTEEYWVVRMPIDEVIEAIYPTRRVYDQDWNEIAKYE